ncbi:hypothetical protein EUGRSUZ_F01054 [Eucalyptus grandis]|uniref:Uncharacterized protein n=2 Tax=Eucalyptus grandis TaxID=71139 RepID=A0ACC3KDR5_EUCGR|nr:hypothetical protein EUGRSUZ_F01054 [Eucalyptus grandis]
MADPPIFSSFCTSIVVLAIKEGETLVSQGRKFKLGFFSAGSSKNSFPGIWFVVSPETVVWVTNRNNPLIDSNGTLEMSNAGELVLLNQSKSVIWSTNSTKVLGNPVAQLLDCGNLMLRESNNLGSVDYSWQRFDHPSNTLLVGMTAGWNVRTGLEHHLTSWRSTDDPSPGDYTYRYKIDRLPQLEIVRKDSVKVYRAGPWDGVEFGGLFMEGNTIINPIFVYNTTDACFAFETLKDDSTAKVILSPDGFTQCHLLKSGSTEWYLMYSLPHDPCDTYGQCGKNGVCRINQSPRCLCLQGFTPKSQEERDVPNSTYGCRRRIPLNCSRRDFMKLSQVKLPDLVDFQLFKNLSHEECKIECLKNCSCTGYANSDLRGAGCLMWFGDLIDIKEIDMDSIRSPSKKLVTIIVASAISGLLLVGMVLGIIWKRRMKRRGELNTFLLHHVIKFRIDLFFLTLCGTDDVDLPLYDFATIAIATNHLSQTNKLGASGFGSAYKVISYKSINSNNNRRGKLNTINSPRRNIRHFYASRGSQ